MIPITKYGMPQVLLLPVITIFIMIAVFFSKKCLPCAVFWAIEAIAFIFLIWALSFFRDPTRQIPSGSNFLVSPADGKITAAGIVDDERFEGGKAFKVTIFLSVFNVHINRMPCKCTVEDITYKPGKFINALNSECTKVNEANDVTINSSDGYGKMIIRQISGAIARRIVCDAKIGQQFECGEKFGMIKFGSCTELYFSNENDFECVVSVGDSVKAGTTKLIEFNEKGQ